VTAHTDHVVQRLRSAPKYRHIHPHTIVDVVAQEAPHARTDAELERRARLKLHKVMADYLLTARPNRLLRGMPEAVAQGGATLREWCRTVLSGHFSTAERLPDLDRFYPTVVELTGQPATVADLACALNPFTLPWLREVTAARYTGYDLNESFVDLATRFLAEADANARVEHRDVLFEPHTIRADVALFLKTYHCVEDRSPGSGLALVCGVDARHVVVSFPVRAMNGRAAVFVPPMVDRLSAAAAERGWTVRRATLSAEDLVVVTKDPHHG
jgi:16S rRNA (guanine(1405)-N(7))-methyltransferase